MVQLTDRLVGLPDVQVSRAARGEGWDGFILVSKGRWWWVGLWPAAWPSVPGGPLVLQVDGYRPGHATPDELPLPVRYHAHTSDGFVVQLVVRPDVDPETLVNEFVSIVGRWISESPLSGGDRANIGG